VAELEDKYSRFKRYTNIDLQAEIAAGGTGDLEDYYTKVETDNLLDDKTDVTDTEALDDRVTALEGSSTDLSDTPRFLLFNETWPTRGSSTRATFFIGGNPDTDAPTDLNLAAGDLWIPFGGEII
jgi:hypothetical protein